MSTNENSIQSIEDQTPSVSPGSYSPVTVTVKDSLGAIFLGILSVILLIGWMRAEARYRAVITQVEVNHGNRSPNA